MNAVVKKENKNIIAKQNPLTGYWLIQDKRKTAAEDFYVKTVNTVNQLLEVTSEKR